MSATTATRRAHAGGMYGTMPSTSSVYPTTAMTASTSSGSGNTSYRLGGSSTAATTVNGSVRPIGNYASTSSVAGVASATSATPNGNNFTGTTKFGPSSVMQTYTPPVLRTAGVSWSVQKEGDRNVIVIEDTPPPGTVASTSQAAMDSTTNTAANAKRARPNGATSQPSATAAYHPSYAIYNAQLSSNTAYQAPAQAESSTAASRKASGAKRKYNEVNDPATANDRAYQARKEAAVAALPCDDKDGHYIIRPDDELGDTRRYKIIRLLGQGTFGKVVEAWDRDARCTVAVKVIRAIQKYRDASKVEVKVLNLLRDRDPANSNKCIHLLDVFDHRNHICIVTKLLSCSVFDFLKDNNYLSFPMSHIQSFAKQLLTSVSFLHDLRLVHTDLKPENILLVDDSYDNIPIRPTKSAPSVRQKRILRNPAIHLIDFGSATFEEEYHASVVSTRHYRAPEIILGLGWSYPCDVWSIGCILVEFFTGEALFQTHENLEHLAMMEIVFGRAPDNRWGKSAVRAKPELFNGGTKINYPQPTTTRQSKKYVKAMRALEAIIPPNNIVNSRFVDLLSHLLRWDPAERYTVREALRHPFFSLKVEDDETRNISQFS